MTEIMTKNRETKSLLAKLMASENINVEYRENAETAAFNTETRTLIMPVFKDMTENATDLFLGHEVGHALYTPQGAIKEVMEKGGLFKGVVNIVEDARIEKMIQSKFPGLKKSFYSGYTDLTERGFFDIKDKDLSELNFVDRINIHFKLGTRAGVEFSDEEMTIVDKIANLRSFDETLKVSEELFEYCKENAEPEPEFPENEFGEEGEDGEEFDDGESEMGDGESGGSSGLGDTEDDGETSDEPAEDSNSDAPSDSEESDVEGEGNNSVESSSDEETSREKSETTSSGRTGSDTVEEALKSTTQDSFERALENHLDDSGSEFRYGNIPKVDVDKVLIPMSEIHAEIDKTITDINAGREREALGFRDFHSLARESFNKFRSEQKSIISYMAKEFEMRKSADEHSRTREGKTGVLNPNKLHAYKFSEDIFLRSNIVADGKNHGFVMFVDWSGSMGSNMSHTIDQLTLLALFCKKVNIPFDVFAFTSAWHRPSERSIQRGVFYEFDDRKNGDLGISRGFSLLHLISSTLSTAKFNSSMVYLRYLREAHGRWDRSYRNTSDLYFPMPDQLGLGGTPLNEAVLTAMEIVPMFQKKNNVQIVNTIFLTDGQGGSLRSVYDSETSQWTGMGYGRDTTNILVDPITKRHYKMDDHDTKTFLEALKDRTDTRLAGFFIAPWAKGSFRREVGYLTNRWDVDAADDMHSDLRKNAFTVIEGDLGYDQFYILSDKNLRVEQAEVEFDSDMTKGRMKNAFIKSRKNKIGNKAMLSKFAEFVS